jgi:hypothetical protein
LRPSAQPHLSVAQQLCLLAREHRAICCRQPVLFEPREASIPKH